MAEDYYGDSTGQAAPAAEAQTEESAEESDVALLPKSFFPADKPLKPGSTCKVRVKEVQEDQVLVTYERDESQEAAPAPPPMDEEMAQYMS